MKKLYEYASFSIAIVFTMTEILLLFILGTEMKMNFFNLIVCGIAMVSWLVFIIIFWRVRQIKKNPVYINAKLIPESVHAIPFFRQFLIKTVVAYHDPQTGKTTLYKGTCMGVWLEYQALKKGEKIGVRVVYDAKHPRNYQVLLDEVVKSIKIY